MYVATEHAKAGKFDTIGVPVKRAETPGCVRRAAPALGQYTAEVFANPPKASGKMVTGVSCFPATPLRRWVADVRLKAGRS